MRTLHALLVGTSLLATSGSLIGGDLLPPPGPIMPTMKTLEQVEPRIDVNSLPGDATAMHVITEPGSYMLTADVLGEPGKHGIRVETDPVWIDLNGFTLRGVPGSLSGIKLAYAGGRTIFPYPIWWFRGTIDSWDGMGIEATGSSPVNLRDLTVINCSGGGVEVENRALLERVRVENCGAFGFRVGSSATLHECISIENAGDGVVSVVDSDNCTLRGLLASNNAGNGVNLGTGATLRECKISDSGLDGVVVGPGSRVEACDIRYSGQNGVVLSAALDPNAPSPPHLVKDCTIEGSMAAGLLGTETLAHLVGDTICGNAVGIDGQAGADNWTVKDTTVSGNTGAGIQTLGNGWLIDGAHVMGNGGNGVLMDGPLQIVRGSTISSNLGSAIIANGDDSTFRNLTVHAVGVTGVASLVSFGANATVESLIVNDSDSTYSGAVVDFTSATRPHVDGLTVSANGVTADAVVAGGAGFEYDAAGRIAATDCTLTAAVMNIVGDGATIRGGSIAAFGTTSAPALVSIAGDAAGFIGCPGETVLIMSTSVMVGVDASGSNNALQGVKIAHVPVGGTGIKVSAGSGNVIENVEIEGSGAAIVDAGDYTVWRDNIVAVTGANGVSAVKLGTRATAESLVVNDSGSTYSGPVVDASADGLTLDGMTIKADGVTADSVVAGGNNLDGGDIDPFANCLVANANLTTAIVKITGDGATIRGGSIKATGTTAAPTALSTMGNGNVLHLDIPFYIRLTANIPTGVDVSGSSNTIGEATIADVPAGGVGIKISSGNGNEIEGCRIKGSGAGAYTGIEVSTNANLVIGNRLSALMGGMAVNNMGAGNILGPVVTPATVDPPCGDCVNYAH